MNIGERIKKLRRTLDLTQQVFGSKIGTTQNNIASYETGRREPSSAAFNNICKTFNVNENWLRTGEGDMFVQLPQNEALASQIRDFLSGDNDSFRERLISMLIRLKPEQWETLEEYAKDLVGFSESGATDIPTVPEPEVDEDAAIKAEARKRAEAYYEQLILEASSGTSGVSTPANTG